MIGFALEGGGAKGAYQAGAYIALTKHGIKPKIITGTSIGAINAALMAQGDLNKLINVWLNTKPEILGLNNEIAERIKHKKFIKSDIKPTYKGIKDVIHNHGIDTTNLLNAIKENINEDKLRKSKVKFGLITVKLSDKITPKQIMIDDIPKGKLSEYILASCYLPIFKMKPIIDNSYYIDGGFYNNVPLSLAEKYGCDTIYSIRIKGIGFNRNKLKKDTKIIEICPRKSLGSMIIFDRESNERNMSLGYYDALKVIKHLDGFDYYFKGHKNKYYDKMVRNVNNKILNTLKRRYFARTHKELIIKIVEKLLTEHNVNEFSIYNIKFIIYKIKKHYLIKDKDLKYFIKHLKLI